MSVRRLEHGWEVRWREQGRHRARRFDRRVDAQAWDAELRRRRQLGPLAVAQLTTTAPSLDQWIEQRWAPEHASLLEQSTRERYANVYERHIAPFLGDASIAELTVGRLRAWQAERLFAGVQPGTIHKARTLLSSVLRHAAEAEAIPGNPLTLVRPPKAPQRDAVRPLAPVTVEEIRRTLLEPPPREVAASAPGQRSRRRYALPKREPRECRRDALIVSLLAYAGLRPGELRALRWGDIGERSLLVERAAAPNGGVKSTKTTQARTVRLLGPLASELREYRLFVRRPPDQALIIATPKGAAWTKSDWQVWRRDHWTVACQDAGLHPVPRPYDLRHSFASLLLAEGRQQLYVAQQLGHSLAVLQSTYAHLFAEFEDIERIDAEAEIIDARKQRCTREVRASAS